MLWRVYWVVHRGQKPTNKDFANGKRLLSHGADPRPSWSGPAGDKLASEVVAKAFKLEGKEDLLKRDVEAFSACQKA